MPIIDIVVANPVPKISTVDFCTCNVYMACKLNHHTTGIKDDERAYHEYLSEMFILLEVMDLRNSLCLLVICGIAYV